VRLTSLLCLSDSDLVVCLRWDFRPRRTLRWRDKAIPLNPLPG
jgi:hypothetical protein